MSFSAHAHPNAHAPRASSLCQFLCSLWPRWGQHGRTPPLQKVPSWLVGNGSLDFNFSVETGRTFHIGPTKSSSLLHFWGRYSNQVISHGTSLADRMCPARQSRSLRPRSRGGLLFVFLSDLSWWMGNPGAPRAKSCDGTPTCALKADLEGAFIRGFL